eukprot:TRINITY_DN4739_c0_g1_i1.p1 TRINITY_DN4739_c0_g1~~TRINITY_DN4739_c0_g1_i1.p1  ORF type:complete len:450 (+),score=136.76 TRINITY_DN4739_c0_g1_i1:690-2039(+)
MQPILFFHPRKVLPLGSHQLVTIVLHVNPFEPQQQHTNDESQFVLVQRGLAQHSETILQMRAKLLAIVGVLAASAVAVAVDLHSKECEFWDLYPRHYIAYKSDRSPVLDGKLNEPFWEEVEFTEAFMDIQGPSLPTPWFVTKAKIRYDDDFLYIGGFVQETQIWANVTQHDQVIFQDNDFEVFIDPDMSTHYYKEYEMNARNVNWDLCLNKPYLNGGYENSSRVFKENGFDMIPAGLQSAAFIDGKLNDPSANNRFWSVEVKFPFNGGLAVNETRANFPPKPKDLWKINFSRVEYKVKAVDGNYELINASAPCENWVWAPLGIIDMHLPERWGYLQFSEARPGTDFVHLDPTFNVRTAMFQLYAAQLDYAQAHGGAYAANVADLEQFVPDRFKASVVHGACAGGKPATITIDESVGYVVEMPFIDRNFGTQKGTVRGDRYVIVDVESAQ